jgi:hypothetical protein
LESLWILEDVQASTVRQMEHQVASRSSPDGIKGPMVLSAQKKKGDGSITVKFGGSAKTLLRYANAWRRDFYRALGALKTFQSNE